MSTKRRCKDCERLSDLLFAANERESKKIIEIAHLQREMELVRNQLLALQARMEGA